MKKIYTGIGSRETPADVLGIMYDLAWYLAMADFLGRSGGADGADDAFERGSEAAAIGRFDVFLPWKGFNGRTSLLYGVDEAAEELASKVHPAWDRMTDGPKKLHSRNCYQILGRQLNEPTGRVICWTPDGCESRKTRSRDTGGTATGIVLASDRGIPVYNLRNEDSRHRLNAWLKDEGINYRVPTGSNRPSPVQVGLF